MTPADRPISIVAGDLYTHVVNFFDDDAQASATDLTDPPRTFRAQVRKDATTIAPVLEDFDVDDTNATFGEIVFTLTAAQTRDLYARVVSCGWDVEETTAGDPITLFQGVVTVIGDYTR